jgi:ATP-dependent Lon protease
MMLQVFDPQEARVRLRELGVDDDDDEAQLDSGGLLGGIGSLGAEESRRAKLLWRLAQDPQDGCRAALIGDEAPVAAVLQLAHEAPNFQTALLPVANALALSARTRRPASIPPLLLLGPPGIGKTHVAKRLAAAIGVPHRLLSMNLSPAFGQIGGLDVAWRGARPGKVAQALVETGCASPLILFDEIDKPMIGTPRETPWDALHSLFEPENAVAFRDEYCDIAFDARHLVSICTANDIDAMPVSLVDRLLVIDVKPPSLEQRRLIAMTLYARQQAEATDVLAPELEPDVLDALAALSPRRIARTIALAIAHAVGHSRDRLSADDVRAAAALVRGRSGEPGQRFGFVPGP